ncbi:hypothetical protein GCM10007423_39420 [Dyadobacter endophyticus]|uniref:Uncharacterized protein n=1 Tax=Dyadobacter endophyticus TaxID=1749036 RepID=A0ABQ1YZN8_9BACT|nr:hypothetical protein [Dyadobacter endophyticus]GGH42653.1 hypothetical protein GCM10007423_39420 [Dyadobacter endophyticus]
MSHNKLGRNGSEATSEWAHRERWAFSQPGFSDTGAENTVQKAQEKTLPKATAGTILISEQLAGVLSFATLKTKGYQMLSVQW